MTVEKTDDTNGVFSRAIFSDCERYRYFLSRVWAGEDTPPSMLPFLMLNPSTADEMKNDPTVERCQRRAESMGYGGFIVLNVFAYRSTDPKGLKIIDDPVGTENDAYIRDVLNQCDKVICAWGNHGQHNKRSTAIHELLRDAEATPFILALNGSGEPKHPLYIGYDHQPFEWDL